MPLADIKWPTGLKRTKPREAVLEELAGARYPQSALDIYTALLSQNINIAQSTVYRTLEAMVNHGLVIKDSLLDSGLVVYELDRQIHTHYAICLGCMKMFQLDICPIEESLDQVEIPDFTVRGHKVEIYGYCKNCPIPA